jgi:hypothetical protein
MSFNKHYTFHIWEKACNTCLSESGLFSWTSWFPVPSIYLQMTISFIFIGQYYSWYYIYLISNFLYPSVHGHLGWFCSFTIVNRAEVMVCRCVSFMLT